jgi:hypothetical protein
MNMTTENKTTLTTEPAIAVEPVLAPVYSFGEYDANDQWYAHKDGVHIKCDEEIIDKLYWQWLMNPTAKRADDSHYTIFKVSEPAMAL